MIIEEEQFGGNVMAVIASTVHVKVRIQENIEKLPPAVHKVIDRMPQPAYFVSWAEPAEPW